MQWKNFRLWLFSVYDQAFQDGGDPATAIPLLFQSVNPSDYPEEWAWIRSNILAGIGVKYGGSMRGHHMDQSNEVERSYRHLAVDSDFGLFSGNEMDQTWKDPYFQLNVRLGFYWAAVEQLHSGLSIWDVARSALENSEVDDTVFVFLFFNKWAAELIPATARGGFLIFHEGLNSGDVDKFPEAEYGTAKKSNVNRYRKIVADYKGQGARMDDLEAVDNGQVHQRNEQVGYNDAGWEIIAGNYEVSHFLFVSHMMCPIFIFLK